ncbi:MAG TPA: hypothetical protein VFZ66_12530 [Herpetosiphonaceae bacterium]
MSHDADHGRPAPDDEAARLRDTVRRLVLMKETGPKSAAWHRARVQTIWRLHQRLERQAAQADQDSPPLPTQAEQRQHPEPDDDRA